METDLPDRATTHEQVREYYARTLKTAADLKTSACCPIDAIPLHIRPLVEKLDPEVIERSYGCGSPIPDELEGRTVLDLGCGTGRDVFVASQLVGEQGAVIGLDMTAEQLEVGERLRESHAERFGHSRSNVRFVQGVLEDLGAAGIERDSVDVVISNCVLNLAPDKRPVLEEIVRVLKPGGELYFSDVFTDQHLQGLLGIVKKLLRLDGVGYGFLKSGARIKELCFGAEPDVESLLRQFQLAGDGRLVSSRKLKVVICCQNREIGSNRTANQTFRGDLKH